MHARGPRPTYCGSVKQTSHLGDPRAAWPRGARASLPGAPGFYVSAVLVLTALCGVVIAGRRFFELDELLALGWDRPRAPSASWASRRDLGAAEGARTAAPSADARAGAGERCSPPRSGSR